MASVNLQVKCLVHSINIRSGPSTSYPATNKYVMKDQTVAVNQKDDSTGWYKLSDGRGWITGSTKYIKIISSSKPATTPNPPAPSAPSKSATNAQPAVVDPTKDAFIDSLKSSSPTGLTMSDLQGQRVEAIGQDSRKTVTKDVNLVKTVSPLHTVVPWDETHLAKDILTVHHNLGISGTNTQIRTKLYERFNRYKLAFPELYLNKAIPVVFFTRPYLNILTHSGLALHEQTAKHPMFYYLYKHMPEVLHSLTYSQNYNKGHDLNVYLSNRADSFEVPDEFIETTEHGETLTGWKMMYGKNNIRSNTAGTFNISYTDDMDLSIYKMHKIWVEYISMVYRGELRPLDDHIKRRILDYPCSVYYFLLAPDGETILFWSKYFGVFPTNVPASGLSWSSGSGVSFPKHNISYAYSWKEDFSPLSLAEFNFNTIRQSGESKRIYVKAYDSMNVGLGRALVGSPFIETVRNNRSAGSDYVYKLRYTKLD